MMKKLITILLLFVTIISVAQKRIYLSSKGIKPTIDNSTIINKVITNAKSGDYLVFPSGNFPIHKTLIQTDKILHWEGNNTNINVALNVTALKISGSDYPPYTTIKGINFINWYDGDSSNSDGIIISAPVKMEDCWVYGFGGNGITVSADVGTTRSSASFSKFRDLLISNNKGDGIYFQGGDANWCIVDGVDCRDNGGTGFNDNSFLGNVFIACMAHNNKRNYAATDGNNRTTFTACYSEQGSLPELLKGSATWFGGFPANGFELHSWAKIYLAEDNPKD